MLEAEAPELAGVLVLLDGVAGVTEGCELLVGVDAPISMSDRERMRTKYKYLWCWLECLQ